MEQYKTKCLESAKAVLALVLQDTPNLTAALDPDNPHHLRVVYPDGSTLWFEHVNGWVRVFPAGESAVYSVCLHQGSDATMDDVATQVWKIKKLVRDAGVAVAAQ